MSVCAGIVTYNPDLARLNECLDSVHDSVDAVLVVDNNSANVEQVAGLVRSRGGGFCENEENRGLGVAYNQIFALAQRGGYGQVLLLDQDSVLGIGMIEMLEAQCGDSNAIVAPRIRDRNIRATRTEAAIDASVEYCISSGSLISVSAWSFVGGYDERLLVDFVDFDFCLRIRLSGFQIERVGKAELLHEIGRVAEFGPIRAYNYKPERLYYLVRDMMFYSWKHRDQPARLKVNGRGQAQTLLAVLFRLPVILMMENEKLAKTSAIVRGIAFHYTRKC